MLSNTARLLALLAGFAPLAQAQQVNRVIGRSGESHRAEDATVLRNNDIALAGERSYFNPYSVMATVSRTSPTGDPIWTLSIDVANEFDTGFGVRELEDNSMIFGFHTGNTNQAVGIARVNSLGQPLWIKCYPGASGYGAAGIEIEKTTSGEFAMIAGRFDTGIGYSKGQLLRVEVLGGAVTGNRSYSTDGIAAVSAHFNDIDFIPNSSDYFVTGAVTRMLEDERSDTDVLVARINRTTGLVVWSNAFTLSPTDDFTRYEEGTGIELAPSGDVFVVARSNDPFEDFGPSGALHLRIDAATGNLLDTSFLPDIQPANASLDTLSNGHLLASGTRAFGDGQGQAQMWEIDPITALVQWRGEYNDGTSFGNDAVEHTTSEGRFLTLAGWNYPSSIPGIGNPDQLFIQADSFGDDGCSSIVIIPDPLVPEVNVNPVTLAVAVVSEPTTFQSTNSLSTLDSAIVCRAGACVGDLNNDGFVDDADFVIFANAYNTLDCADPAMPAGCPADLNADGLVDDADFSIFVVAYDAFLCT